MKLDDFISQRHNDLVVVIKKMKTQYPTRKTTELITDLWLEMRKKSMFVANESDFWFFSVKYIQNRLTWKDGWDLEILQNGSIKYRTRKKINRVEMDIEVERDWDIIDNNDRLSAEQKSKIESVHKIYDKMTFYDKQLYEMYFDEGLSVDKITKIFNDRGAPISRSSVYNMIKELIEKIKGEL